MGALLFAGRRQAVGWFLATLALEMGATLNAFQNNGHPVQFRMGINSGEVVGGVIGQEKFHYDIWGDAVNVASRMESHGVPGRIQVTQATYDLLNHQFDFEPQGKIEVKGVGEMETWFLVGMKDGGSGSCLWIP